MDKQHEATTEDEPPAPEPSEMLPFLLGSQQEAVNGETVPLEEVLAELRATAAELEQRLVRSRA